MVRSGSILTSFCVSLMVAGVFIVPQLKFSS
jgi:hypothetical protein